MNAPAGVLARPARLAGFGPALAAVLRRADRATKWAFTMRAAIFIMLGVAVAAAIGTFIPQEWVNPGGAAEFRRRYPAAGRLARDLGLFDLYGAWWFQAAVAFVVASITRCVVFGRLRAWLALRRLRRPARAEQPSHWPLQTAAEASLDVAAAALRARGYRVVAGTEGIVAERGRINELGSYAFHLAIVAVLVAATYGQLTGFFGITQPIVAGERWVDTPQKYDSLRRGILAAPPSGLELAVDRFGVGYTETGQPIDFVTEARLAKGADEVAAHAIRVNDPLRYAGVKFYQSSYGWAPLLEVRGKDGRLLAGGHVVFPGSVWGSPGVLKVPAAGAAGQQLGLELYLVPDARVNEDNFLISESPEPRLPILYVQPWRGDLRLDRPQNVYTLDKRDLRRDGDWLLLPLGASAELPGGETVTFAGLDQWTALAVASDPGVPWIYAALVIGGVGLMTRLYWPHRQVFVRAIPTGILLSGTARPWPPAFKNEFASLARALERATAQGS